MGGNYAGYADLMAAPAGHVALTRLVLMGKAQANNDTVKELEGGGKNGGGTGAAGGSGNPAAGGRTTVSRYEP